MPQLALLIGLFVVTASTAIAFTTPQTAAVWGSFGSCIFNGTTVRHGNSVTAYQSPSVPYGSTCVSQQRKCTFGKLSGTYQHASCSVSPPVFSVTPTGETIDQYYPLKARKGGLLVAQNNQTQKVSQWATLPMSATVTDLTWGDPNNWPGANASTEEFELKTNCAKNHDFLWLNAYKDKAKGYRFGIKTTRAEIRVGSGPWFDITDGGSCGTTGHPYMLSKLVNEQYELRVWGNTLKLSGELGRRFFWQHKVGSVPSSVNACWKNDAQTTRKAITQEEAWWDSDNGWMAGGSGSMGANGEPDGVTVSYVRSQHIAKDAGPGWTTSGSIKYCMQYQWNW